LPSGMEETPVPPGSSTGQFCRVITPGSSAGQFRRVVEPDGSAG